MAVNPTRLVKAGGGGERKMKKSVIRKELGIKKGGRLQISAHGCAMHSVQVFRNGRLAEDCNIPREIARKAGLA